MLVDLTDLHDIIGYQTMSSAHKLECCLTLTDTALSHNQKSLAVDIYKHAVNGDARCQLLAQAVDQLRHELGCASLGSEYRQVALLRNFEEHLVRL